MYIGYNYNHLVGFLETIQYRIMYIDYNYNHLVGCTYSDFPRSFHYIYISPGYMNNVMGI